MTRLSMHQERVCDERSPVGREEFGASPQYYTHSPTVLRWKSKCRQRSGLFAAKEEVPVSLALGADFSEPRLRYRFGTYLLSVCRSVKHGFYSRSGSWFSTKSVFPLPDGVRELTGQNVIREVSSTHLQQVMTGLIRLRPEGRGTRLFSGGRGLGWMSGDELPFWFKNRAIAPDGHHDDGEFSGSRDSSFLEAFSVLQPLGPSAQL